MFAVEMRDAILPIYWLLEFVAIRRYQLNQDTSSMRQFSKRCIVINVIDNYKAERK